MSMIVTIASGKGGTGKTTVAVSLALSLAEDGRGRPLLVDCDVEEPNAALFLRPTLQQLREVGLMIPQVDFDICNSCGRCAEVCQYHAMAIVGQKVMVFPELCHGCGSCTLNCPTGAIHEVLHVIGTIERGWAGRPPGSGGTGGIEFAHGTMNVGEPMAVPIIRQLKSWVIPSSASVAGGTTALGGAGDRPVILDASPGTACPVAGIERLRSDSDRRSGAM